MATDLTQTMSRTYKLSLTETDSQEQDMPPVPQRKNRGMVPRPITRPGYKGACKAAMSLEFYYGRVTNKQLEDLLKPHMDTRGSFLLRDSNTEPGNLTISVVDNPRHIYNFKVNCTATGMFEVTPKLVFWSLPHLVEYFWLNDVPGKDIDQLKLLKPICSYSPTRTTPTSPPAEAIPSLPPRKNKMRSPSNSLEKSNYSSFMDSRAPLPIPNHGTEPMYIVNNHVYCRAEDLKKSRVDEIMELCKISEQKHKKCSCGLYIDQSQLVDNWMMHIDRPDTEGASESDLPGSGHIFFVNSVTNETTWELPKRVMSILEDQFPEKFKLVQKLLQEGGNL